jgi:hypothetical protein
MNVRVEAENRRVRGRCMRGTSGPETKRLEGVPLARPIIETIVLAVVVIVGMLTARKVRMLPPRRRTLATAGGHCDPSEKPAKMAASPSNIAAIAPRLWDSLEGGGT